MRTLLERVDKLDHLIRQLTKLASRVRSGENVDAYRECNRMIAEVQKNKRELIEEDSATNEN